MRFGVSPGIGLVVVISAFPEFVLEISAIDVCAFVISSDVLVLSVVDGCVDVDWLVIVDFCSVFDGFAPVDVCVCVGCCSDIGLEGVLECCLVVESCTVIGCCWFIDSFAVVDCWKYCIVVSMTGQEDGKIWAASCWSLLKQYWPKGSSSSFFLYRRWIDLS